MLLSEAVELAFIDKIPVIVAAVASIIAALGTTAAGYFTYRSHGVITETKEIALKTAEIARKTEENTNHLKDELVAEVRTAAFAAGKKEGEG